jgi:hypothetical protein
MKQQLISFGLFIYLSMNSFGQTIEILAKELPPYFSILTTWGLRPEWDEKSENIYFLDKMAGDVFKINLQTRQITGVTTNFNHAGIFRVLCLQNGDLLLGIGGKDFDPSDPEKNRHKLEMYILKKNNPDAPISLGEFMDEGPAISRNQMKIAWTLPGQREICMADIAYINGIPKLVNKEIIISYKDSSAYVRLETQDFRPPFDDELLYTHYWGDAGDAFHHSETYGYNLKTGKYTNYTHLGNSYNEAEGIYPDGNYILIESDRHQPLHNRNQYKLDVYKLKLDGSGEVERLADFSTRYPGILRSDNPVVDRTGRYIAMQFGFMQGSGNGKGIFLFDIIKYKKYKLSESIDKVSDTAGAVYYVSAVGDDGNPGTNILPFKTFEAARDAARNDNFSRARIIILPGEYFLSEIFELDSRDNGLTIESEKKGTVIIYGGEIIADWYPGEGGFWYADVPDVRKGIRDFRLLVVNGQIAERSRFPDTATFIHKQSWDVKILPSIAGGWERQPYPEEKVIMAYDPKDIPEALDIRNAELRVYHMWDESMVGISGNDLEKHIFTFSNPAVYPPGAFGIKKYIIFNTREGMTRPGQWYLDRSTGRIVYWPKENEAMDEAIIMVPRLEKIFSITGTNEKPAEQITIRGLRFEVTNIPLKPAGWAGGSFEGAVSLSSTENCILDDLEICNVAGLGISAVQTNNSSIVDCNIHHTGACGLKYAGSGTCISGNRIHDIGINFPSSCALYVTGDYIHIYRNQIYNGPYSGMIIHGGNNLVEENHISRVMQELHDGAAIYSSGSTVQNSILRGNLVSDIVAIGEGFGVSSYYFDEGAHNCLVERNVSLGVARPTHNHIVSGITYRDNLFITEEDMAISFQRSANCTFESNILVAPGNIDIVQPNGIQSWKNNVVYRNGITIDGHVQDFIIDSLMPSFDIPESMTQPADAVKITKIPELDGNIGLDEWPGEFHTLNREPSRLPASGAPVLVKFSYDKNYLYIGTIVTMFDPINIRKGNVWEQDDGLELTIRGTTPEGKPVNYIFRLFADNSLKSLTLAGAPDDIATKLEKEIRFFSAIKSGKYRGGGWYSEMSVPLKILGIKAVPGLKIPFNMCAYCNEYGKWHCWEGTQGESWDLDQGGWLRFK